MFEGDRTGTHVAPETTRRKRHFRVGLLACVAVTALNTACTTPRPAPVATGDINSTLGKPPAGYKVGQPYQIGGVWYYPRTDWAYDETGIASWYGEEFQGKPTANGETFDLNGVSAAHKTLQMPVEVRVTNLDNGRSIVARVNDRGPFVNNRIIDMSRRAAQLLGYERQGTARVRVQVIPPSGGVSVAGAPAFIAAKPVTAEDERTAAAAAPQGKVAAQALPPPPGVSQAPPLAKGGSAVPPRPPTTPSPPTPTAAAVGTASEKVTVTAVPKTQIYVQAGAFTRFANANRLKAQLGSFGQTSISQAAHDGLTYFRVRIGPVNSVDEADQLLDRVIGNGQNSARIVVE